MGRFIESLLDEYDAKMARQRQGALNRPVAANPWDEA